MQKLDVKSMSVDALQAELEKIQASLVDMKFSHAVTPMENPTVLGAARKEVARILTELRARELASLAAAGTLPARNKIIARRRKSN